MPELIVFSLQVNLYFRIYCHDEYYIHRVECEVLWLVAIISQLQLVICAHECLFICMFSQLCPIPMRGMMTG